MLIDVDFVFPIFLCLFWGDKQWNLNSEGKSKGSRNTGQQALPIFVAPESTITSRRGTHQTQNALRDPPVHPGQQRLPAVAPPAG